MNEDFEFKLAVETMHPDGVWASDLAELLRDWEKAIEAESLSEESGTSRPDANASSPVISLVAIRGGSACYGMKVNPNDRRAVENIVRGLAEPQSRWAVVSPMAQEGVTKSIKRFTDRGIPFEINSHHPTMPNVRFTRDNPPPEVNQTLHVESAATRSVEVVKAGGVRPAASVKLVGDDYRIPVHANRRIIQLLGEHLYKRVILKGRAVWRLKDWRMVSFKAESVSDYPSEDIELVLLEAAAASKGVWERAGGVEGFLAETRGDEDDD